MSAFTGFVVEDAALAWLEGLGYAVHHGLDIAAGEGWEWAVACASCGDVAVVRGQRSGRRILARVPERDKLRSRFRRIGVFF